jgi:hypothetical protein
MAISNIGSASKTPKANSATATPNRSPQLEMNKTLSTKSSSTGLVNALATSDITSPTSTGVSQQDTMYVTSQKDHISQTFAVSTQTDDPMNIGHRQLLEHYSDELLRLFEQKLGARLSDSK